MGYDNITFACPWSAKVATSNGLTYSQPDMHLLGWGNVCFGVKCLVELKCRLDRVRLVLALVLVLALINASFAIPFST